jgi:hypothetical protein
MAAAAGRWRDAGSPHPGTLAAALGFIHTTIRPTQYWRCFAADLRPVSCRRRVAEYSSSHVPAGFAPATWVAWCVT